MKYLFLIPLLMFCGCTGWDHNEVSAEYGGLSFNNRLNRWAQSLLNGLTIDGNGSHGILTTICTPGYSYHSCSFTCTTDGSGNYSTAAFTCSSDSSEPTGFVTVGCSSDSFSQGLQGTLGLSISLADASTARVVVTAAGPLYILDKSGNYIPEGVFIKEVLLTLIFQKTSTQTLSYLCEDGTSNITYDHAQKECTSLTFPFSC